MSKYSPLTQYLRQMKADRFRISFKDIEEILGFNLPDSARKHPAWWANQRSHRSPQSEAWLKAGWKAFNLDLEAEKITFQLENPKQSIIESDGQMSKYSPLTQYLHQMKADRFCISFKAIEEIIGTDLPDSARKYPAWWANQRSHRSPQSEAWLKAGWEAVELDLAAEKITFQLEDHKQAMIELDRQMRKYTPLTQYLHQMQADCFRISFTEIEDIIDDNLPDSARKYPAWWANERANKHRQCYAWLKAGWETVDLDLGSEKITFQRIE